MHLDNGEYQSSFWYDKKKCKKVMDLSLDISNDVLNAKGYCKINSKNKVVDKAALSIKESEWFEDHKNLPFTGEEDNNFLELAGDFLVGQNVEYETAMERLCKAYFNDYYIEEKCYYIKITDYKGEKGYLSIDFTTNTWSLKKVAMVKTCTHNEA